MEIIVVYHDGVENVLPLMKEFSTVQLYRASGQQTQEKMIALGISYARGRVVALTVDHCTPEEHWCARIVKAHAGPYAVVGGGLEMGEQPDTAVNWAVHFYDYCSYGYYQSPVRKGPARELSDCNVSYKQKVLTSTADLWVNGFNVPLMNRIFLAHGETLWFSPDLLVYQHRAIDFRNAARIAYHRGHVFASARAAKSTFSQRLFYTVFSPFLPLKLLGKLLVNIIPKRSHWDACIRAFPLIVLFSALWSLGEFSGFLTGKVDETILVAEE